MKCIYFVFLFLVAMAGCTTTRLTNSWIDPSAGNKQYKKIMVVSTGDQIDKPLRVKMEKHLSEDLQMIGYEAVCYNDLFKEGELKNLRYDTVRKLLADRGIDGVITIGLMATEKEQVYVTDKGNQDQQNIVLGNFWESPRTVKQQAGKPGYYVSSTHYFWQSHFYDVSTVGLVYSAQSKAFEVASTESMAHKYGRMIVDDMQKNYILSAKK